MKYSEILKLNRQYRNNENSDEYKIFIMSNIVVNTIKEIFEYLLIKNGIKANIKFSKYNNIIQESINISEYDLVIVFWEFNNLFEGFQYTIEAKKNNKLLDIILKIKKDIDYLLNNLKNCPQVIVNKFTNNQFHSNSLMHTKGDEFCENLNNYLKNQNQNNLVLIDLNKVFLSIGLDQSIDRRFYYSYQSLYTTKFYYKYCEYILPYILSIKGKTKKAVIFDCDNTLWHGIVGEDGQENIRMNQDTYEGRIFFEVQNIILSMVSKGIIIGICSKNNEIDVMNVLDNHPDMLLKREHFSIIKINWYSKEKNILNIAKELNLGLDSIVFVDDSNYEIELVKNMIPEVHTLKVPEDLYEYPNTLINLTNIFLKNYITQEDIMRTQSYKEQMERKSNNESFSNLNDYLLLLETKLNIFIDNLSHLERLSQLILKTNQFNLTTKRYSKEKINNMIKDENFLVFSLKVEDKFGNLGLTGISIIKLIDDKNSAEIDIFLLSCRIIGRKIEDTFLNHIIQILKSKGIIKIKALYVKTIKNEIVSNFYQEFGFQIKSDNNNKKIYELDSQKFTFKDSKLFKVKIEK